MKNWIKQIFNRQRECRLIQSIDSLTLSDFFTAMHDGETKKALTISGKPTQEQVIAAWKNCLYDFEFQTDYTLLWAEIWLYRQYDILQQEAMGANSMVQTIIDGKHFNTPQFGDICDEALEKIQDAAEVLKDIEAIRGFRNTKYLTREFFDHSNKRLATFFRTQIDINLITVSDWIDLMNQFFLEMGIGIR